MTYNVVNERHDVEKLACDIVLNNDEYMICIDAADIDSVRRGAVMKYGISLKMSIKDDGYVGEFEKLIKSLGIPTQALKYTILNMRVTQETMDKMEHETVSSILNTLYLQPEDGDTSCYPDIIWSIGYNEQLVKDEILMTIIFAYEKSEQDSLEDEKYDEMIMKYLSTKIPPINDDIFSVLPQMPRSGIGE